MQTIQRFSTPVNSILLYVSTEASDAWRIVYSWTLNGLLAFSITIILSVSRIKFSTSQFSTKWISQRFIAHIKRNAKKLFTLVKNVFFLTREKTLYYLCILLFNSSYSLIDILYFCNVRFHIVQYWTYIKPVENFWRVKCISI